MPSSPNGPCSTGKRDVGAQQPAARIERERLAVRPAPAAVALEQHRDRPRGPPAATPADRRLRRGERDLVLRRAPAVQDRDPHGVGVGVGVGVGSGVGDLEAADGDRHPSSPAGAASSGLGSWSTTIPSSSGVSTSCRCTRTWKPASSSVVARVVLGRVEHAGHRHVGRRLGDDERDGAAGFDQLRAGRGILRAAPCRARRPRSSRSVTDALQAGVLERRLGVRRARWPTTSGTATFSRPRETTSVTVVPLRTLESLRRRRLDHAARLHRVGELAPLARS